MIDLLQKCDPVSLVACLAAQAGIPLGSGRFGDDCPRELTALTVCSEHFAFTADGQDYRVRAVRDDS